MYRWLIGILPVVLFGLVAYVLYLGLGKDPSLLRTALESKPVPAFQLPILNEPERVVTETALTTGDVVLLNIFASWCVPCRAEHAQIKAFSETDGLQVFGLNYKNHPNEATAWLDELGNPYSDVLADIDGRVAIEFGTYGVPETFVIDAGGIIRYRHAGPIMPQDMEEMRAIIEQVRQAS